MYLWISHYKGIREENFNFSSKCRCAYDFKNNIFSKKDIYNSPVQKIFGDRLSISLIVGENGSGKSTLLEVINIILEKEEVPFKYLLVFSDGNFKTNIENEPEHPFLIKNKKKIYLSKFSAENGNIRQNLHKDITIHTDRGSEILSFIFKYKDEYKSNIFDYRPSKMQVLLKNPEEVFIKFIEFLNEFVEANNEDIDKDEVLHDKLEKLDHLVQLSNKRIFKDPFSNLLFTILLDAERYDFSSAINILLETFEEANSKYSYGFFIALDKLIKNDSELINQFELDNYEKLLELIVMNNQNFINVKDISGDMREILLLNYNYLSFKFKDELDREYEDLSHGEKTIFSIISHINIIIDDYQRTDTYLFLFDEVEISLHPRWQISLVEELNTYFSNTKNDIQIIFTTHSPLLTSDVPAGNIIYMEKINNQCCVNAELSIEETTLGANIYTLLSKSFFLDQGAIGYFSKKKINNLLKFLDTKVNCEEYQFEDVVLNSKEISFEDKKIYVKEIISMVGEEFLRDKMFDMFSIKFDAGNHRRREYLLTMRDEIDIALDELDND